MIRCHRVRSALLCLAIVPLASSLLAGHLGAQATPAKGGALFDPIASVLQSPRCINCHPAGDVPHQKDTHIPHLQHVIRGPYGTGSPALPCSTCHQNRNSAEGAVPGAPGWRLAPLSMKWEGLTKGQICESIKDPNRNGNRRTLEEVIAHMKSDSLVLWAWHPGADRTVPPVSHEQLVRDLNAWVAAGGPCPSN
ncbi:MAG TPA: hypothetical protein VNW46_08670 [Gemmatimonadaceae bacterium]|jgi:hypothetical protein|nr:hypothetical protein [Gemmatimonadaceae bacterium]